MYADASTMALLWTAVAVFSTGVVLNCLVVLAIRRSGRMWTPVNLMVTVLAVIGILLLLPDLVVCCYNIYFHQTAGSNSVACTVQGFASLISASAHLGVLTIVSYNRYDVVTNRAVWSVKRTLLSVLVVVLLSCVYLIWIYSGIQQMVQQSNQAYCIMDWKDNHGAALVPTILVLVIGWACSAFNFVCYCRVYAAYRSHTDTLKQASVQQRKEMNLSYNVAIIVFTFVIFWTPYLALIVYSVATGHFVNYIYDACALALVATNACATPFMFVLINQQLRRSLVEMLTCQRTHESLISPAMSRHATFIDRSPRIAPDPAKRHIRLHPSSQSAMSSPLVSQHHPSLLQVLVAPHCPVTLSARRLVDYQSSFEDSAAVHPDKRTSWQSPARSSYGTTTSPSHQQQQPRQGRASDLHMICSPLRIEEVT